MSIYGERQDIGEWCGAELWHWTHGALFLQRKINAVAADKPAEVAEQLDQTYVRRWKANGQIVGEGGSERAYMGGCRSM